MEKIKVIKTEQDYQDALKLAEKLISHDPDPDSTEGEQLSLLGTLIQDYEARAFPIALPSPIEAIKFRMDQAGLKPTDLIPYLGSRSRVSEILSGKRQLTIDMIRTLSEGLGIPAKVLIKQPEPDGESEADEVYE
jgi:HTH-type transcriptional regulator / antitoxin HigA